MGLQEPHLNHLIGAAVVNPPPVPQFEYDIVANEYGFYCVPHDFKGREVPEILANGGVYEPATLGLMARLLRQGGDVITGGTFIGDFLPALSEALTPGARLHTFEPNPIAREAALFSAWLNGLRNIDMHDCAVGEAPGALHLQVAKPNGNSMAARAKVVDEAAEGETITVETKTLDSLVDTSRQVALIHLDVEGHEWPAILGARQIIATHSPCIIVEAERGWKRRNIEAGLAELFPLAGYRRAGLIERNAIYMPQNARGLFRSV